VLAGNQVVLRWIGLRCLVSANCRFVWIERQDRASKKALVIPITIEIARGRSRQLYGSRAGKIRMARGQTTPRRSNSVQRGLTTGIKISPLPQMVLHRAPRSSSRSPLIQLEVLFLKLVS